MTPEQKEKRERLLMEISLDLRNHCHFCRFHYAIANDCNACPINDDRQSALMSLSESKENPLMGM